MSRDGYLPPGVEHGDLPGNTPEDEEWDKLFEWFPTGLTAAEIKDRVTRAPEMAERIEQLEACLDGAEAVGDEMAEEIKRLEAQRIVAINAFALKTLEAQTKALHVEARRNELVQTVNYCAGRLELEPAPVLHGGRPMMDKGDVQAVARKLRAATADTTPEREDDADRGSHYAFCEPTP